MKKIFTTAAIVAAIICAGQALGQSKSNNNFKMGT